jgi:hypothetical protein
MVRAWSSMTPSPWASSSSKPPPNLPNLASWEVREAWGGLE